MYKVIIILLVIISITWGENYYEILGVNKSADQDEIRKAFKKLAIIYHPDKNTDDPNAHNKFVRLTTAYEVLKQPDLRKKYDFYKEEDFDNIHRKHSYPWTDQNNIYDNDNYVIILQKIDYYENVWNSDFSWFLNFYSPMCSHCHHLAPTWKKVAKLLDGVVKIAAINCEDNWQLCYQVGIKSYPTLLYFTQNSKHGIHYVGEKTQEAIMRFALDKLNIHIPEISEVQWKLLLTNKIIMQRSILIFICGVQRNCFTSDERLIATVILDKLIDVNIYICEDKCHDKVSYNTHAVYIPMHNTLSQDLIFFNNISDINTLITMLLEQLPNPLELTDNDFESLRKTSSHTVWLICFYLDDTATVDLQMKKLSAISTNLGKIHCGRNVQLCNKLGVNHYPMWGILKPNGAFELNHGKNTNNDIIKFVRISTKTINIRALIAEEILSIMQRKNDENVWFLDWYAPWCPPCIQFLSELRRASLEFDESVIRFGTIDCSVHNTLCYQYNIRVYPTAMLINGSNTYQFTLPKTAMNVIQFINEKRNPSVIELTAKTFHSKVAKKKKKFMWIVDYFVPWCGPCQRLVSEWTAVAKSLSNLSFVNVASVNCESEAVLCESQGINSYPDIRMYPFGSEGLNTVALYRGYRDALSMLTWITTFFPKKIHNLNPSIYQRQVLNSKHIWLVDFYIPQCAHCHKMEPEFAIAAQLLDKVKFGKLDCNVYTHECMQANAKFFPMLMLYNSKHKKKNNYNGIQITAMTAEEIKNEVLKIINVGLQHDEL